MKFFRLYVAVAAVLLLPSLCVGSASAAWAQQAAQSGVTTSTTSTGILSQDDDPSATSVHTVHRLPLPADGSATTDGNAESAVSTSGEIVSTESPDTSSKTADPSAVDSSSVAQASPVAAQIAPRAWLAAVILASVFFGALLFVLLWSVLNGWFERLIF